MLIIALCTGSLGMNVVVCYVGRTSAAATGMAACGAPRRRGMTGGGDTVAAAAAACWSWPVYYKAATKQE